MTSRRTFSCSVLTSTLMASSGVWKCLKRVVRLFCCLALIFVVLVVFFSLCPVRIYEYVCFFTLTFLLLSWSGNESLSAPPPFRQWEADSGCSFVEFMRIFNRFVVGRVCCLLSFRFVPFEIVVKVMCRPQDYGFKPLPCEVSWSACRRKGHQWRVLKELNRLGFLLNSSALLIVAHWFSPQDKWACSAVLFSISYFLVAMTSSAKSFGCSWICIASSLLRLCRRRRSRLRLRLSLGKKHLTFGFVNPFVR